MKHTYYLKTQPRLYRFAFFFIIAAIVVTNFLLQDYGSWRMERIFIELLPVFFTATVISDEYEQRREGLLFVSRTPIFKQAVMKFGYGWLFSQTFILLAFISAYFTHMEQDFTRWIVLVIYSTFLSLLGFTVSNITRKSLYGLGSALVYWVVMVTMGFSSNEKLWPVSVVLNNDLSIHVVWGNLASLLGLSYLLFVFNIWFIGKGEGIRKPLVVVNSMLLLMVLAALGVYGYMGDRWAVTPIRIINADQGSFIVVATNNPEVTRVLNEHHLKFVSSDDVSISDFSKQDIVLITSSEDEIDNSKLQTLLAHGNVAFTDMGIKAGDKEIYEADAYRTIFNNVFNPDKKVVHLDSREWNHQDIQYLLNTAAGSFIALHQGIPVARSNYSKVDKLDDQMKLTGEESWFVQGEGTFKVLYQTLSEIEAKEFLTIWEPISEQVNKLLPAPMNVKVLQITNGHDGVLGNPNTHQTITLNYRTIKELEPSKFGGRDWLDQIAVSLLSQTLFQHFDHRDIQYSISQYVFLDQLGQSIETKIPAEYMKSHYEFSLKERAQAMLEEGRYLQDNKELLNAGNANSLLYYMLHQIDSLPNADSFWTEITLNENGSEGALKELFAKYLPLSDIELLFNLYNPVANE